jgi:hypothetical protein
MAFLFKIPYVPPLRPLLRKRLFLSCSSGNSPSFFYRTMGSNQNKSLADLTNKKLLQTKGYINGEWVDAKSGKTFDVVDPATGEKLVTLPEMGKEDTARAIDSAYEAFQTWKKTDARSRARILRKWNDLCIANADDLALILTLENGKPLPEAKGEVLYGSSFIEWFAGEAERLVTNMLGGSVDADVLDLLQDSWRAYSHVQQESAHHHDEATSWSRGSFDPM